MTSESQLSVFTEKYFISHQRQYPDLFRIDVIAFKIKLRIFIFNSLFLLYEIEFLYCTVITYRECKIFVISGCNSYYLQFNIRRLLVFLFKYIFYFGGFALIITPHVALNEHINKEIPFSTGGNFFLFIS